MYAVTISTHQQGVFSTFDEMFFDTPREAEKGYELIVSNLASLGCQRVSGDADDVQVTVECDGRECYFRGQLALKIDQILSGEGIENISLISEDHQELHIQEFNDGVFSVSIDMLQGFTFCGRLDVENTYEASLKLTDLIHKHRGKNDSTAMGLFVYFDTIDQAREFVAEVLQKYPLDKNSDVIIDVFNIIGTNHWVIRAFEPSGLFDRHSALQRFDDKYYGSMNSYRPCPNLSKRYPVMSQERIIAVTNWYQKQAERAKRAILAKYPTLEESYDVTWRNGDAEITDEYFDPDGLTRVEGKHIIPCDTELAYDRSLFRVEVLNFEDYQVLYIPHQDSNRIVAVIHRSTKQEALDRIRVMKIDHKPTIYTGAFFFGYEDWNFLPTDLELYAVRYGQETIGVVERNEGGWQILLASPQMPELIDNSIFADSSNAAAELTYRWDKTNRLMVRPYWYCGKVIFEDGDLWGESEATTMLAGKTVTCSQRYQQGHCSCNDKWGVMSAKD